VDSRPTPIFRRAQDPALRGNCTNGSQTNRQKLDSDSRIRTLGPVKAGTNSRLTNAYLV